MIKVSVIIPTYNREKYLIDAIKLLKAQTLKEVEFIIIDDGSQDNTQKVLKKEIGKDKRFKIIEYKENKGPSYARNQGLKISKGEYIGFFDIDDSIPTDYYEILYANAKESDADVSFAATGSNPIDLKEKFNLLRKGSIWDKIYRRSFLNEENIAFLEGYFTADTLFTVQTACLSKSFVVTGKTAYEYKLQSDSIGVDKKHLNRRKNDIFIVIRHIKNFIQKQNLSQDEYDAFLSFMNRSYAGYKKDKVFQKKLCCELGIKKTNTKENKMLLLKFAKFLHIISSKKYKELRAIKLFKKSKLFDAKWYLATYPDVAQSHLSAEKHYYKHGWKEGRNPSPLFDGNAYLKENLDVKDANKNPLEHYLLSGQYEGRYYCGWTHNDISVSRSNTSFSERIRYILTYPIRLQEECERLKAEIKELEKQLKK